MFSRHSYFTPQNRELISSFSSIAISEMGDDIKETTFTMTYLEGDKIPILFKTYKEIIEDDDCKRVIGIVKESNNIFLLIPKLYKKQLQYYKLNALLTAFQNFNIMYNEVTDENGNAIKTGVKTYLTFVEWDKKYLSQLTLHI